MTGALVFFGITVVLAISTAALAVALLALQNSRRYVDIAEERLEHLRKGQSLLLLLLREQWRSAKEERPERKREQRLAVLQRSGKAHETQEWESRAWRDAVQKIDELKRDFQKPYESNLESAPPKTTRDSGKGPRPANFPETRASKSAKEPSKPSEDKKPRLAVRHPHPDDDISPEGKPSGNPLPKGDAPVEMFRRHYDRYLENYEGYVRLAERIQQERYAAKTAPGSPEEREQEERLGRLHDGINRTIARLDMLEGYNPELATDDRISRRAIIAESHARLDKIRQSRGGS